VGSPPGPSAETPDRPSPADASLADMGGAGPDPADERLFHASLVHGRPDERGTTFLGRDPKGVAAQAIAHTSPTACQARTRLYQGGQLTREGFPVAQISDLLADESAVVWLDLHNPGHDDLSVISGEFGLHPLAVEDAVQYHERTKLDRYHSHLFLLAYAVRLDPGTGELTTSELAAFITRQALITVRKDDGLDIGMVLDYWDESPDLAGAGVSYLLHGVLDYLVDTHFAAVQAMDSSIESLEDELFDEASRGTEVQRRSFELRKSLVMLRRVVLPMREVVNTLMRRDLHVVSEEIHPYYQDVYDHVLRATEWTESLRDLVTTILETNLTIQGNRMNVITKKVTSWAAIVAVPTFVTGFYGMNVPYPGFGKSSGVLTALVLMFGIAAILYVVFRKRDWL
jgi:magnesium transporter